MAGTARILHPHPAHKEHQERRKNSQQAAGGYEGTVRQGQPKRAAEE